jgi:hypothetical protein
LLPSSGGGGSGASLTQASQPRRASRMHVGTTLVSTLLTPTSRRCRPLQLVRQISMRGCEGYGSLLAVYCACVYIGTKASHRVALRCQLSHMLSCLLRVPITSPEVRRGLLVLMNNSCTKPVDSPRLRRLLCCHREYWGLTAGLPPLPCCAGRRPGAQLPCQAGVAGGALLQLRGLIVLGCASLRCRCCQGRPLPAWASCSQSGGIPSSASSFPLEARAKARRP